MEQTAKRVIFKGRVQGVGFRYTVLRIVQRYDISGYVKNCPDGSVEALLQGPGAHVQAGLSEIQDTFGGYIRQTVATEIPANPQYYDFRITY